MARLALLLSALALVPGAIRAQDTPKPSDDRWQIGLENGQYIWDIRLVRLQGDTLVFRQADTLGTVSVQQIGELRLVQKSTVRIGQGAAAGGAISALTGSDDEVYDLLTLDYPARIRTIQQILLLHPPSSP
ncbi:MAG TPA: hypothetical protein VL853_00250 [Gemmatimonadales bacterium]|jgi:hypothetical protein|nr:hypothetical protein [Gemmatimonadales bacterium]